MNTQRKPLYKINRGTTVFFSKWKGWSKTHTYTLKRFDYKKKSKTGKVAVLYSDKLRKLFYVDQSYLANCF